MLLCIKNIIGKYQEVQCSILTVRFALAAGAAATVLAGSAASDLDTRRRAAFGFSSAGPAVAVASSTVLFFPIVKGRCKTCRSKGKYRSVR